MFKLIGSSLVAAGIVLFASASFADNHCDTDYNGDGQTDVQDFEIFEATVGSTDGDDNFVQQADHNGDGSVTVVDYGIFLSCN